MEYILSDLKACRKFQNLQIQHEYDKLQTYEDKITYIYKLLLKTQGQIEKEYKGDFFKKNSLQRILDNFKKLNIKDEVSFVNFVNEYIVSKTISPHNTLKPIKIDKMENQQNSQNLDVSSENSPKEQNVEYNFEDNTLVVKIKSFKSKYLQDDKKIFKKLEQELKNKNCKNLIIDIRGNGGGTDEYFSFLTLFTKNDILENFAYIDALTGEKVETKVVSIKGLESAKDFDRYLLVDKEVFSSADGLTRLCKNTGFATVVGEKTRGEGIGLTPFDLKIATANKVEQERYNIQGVNMQFSPEKPLENESYMTLPDIVCDPTKAKEVAIDLIKKKQQKNEQERVQ